MSSQEEYFSFVRHELRNQLGVFREGVSQVLDGLCHGDWKKCSSILQPCLECADKLDELIGLYLTQASLEKMGQDVEKNHRIVLSSSVQESLGGVPMAKLKVLVVDDEVHFLEVIRLRLETAGYAVFTAENGDEALRKVETVKPNVVLLDIVLGQDDGLEILKKIRSLDTNLAIFMVTAYSNEERFKSAQEFGASGFISKNGDLKKAIESIKNVIEISGRYRGQQEKKKS